MDNVARFYDDTSSWKDSRGYDLSQRLWGNSQKTLATIDDIIRQGIRDGATVDEVANELTSWVRPGISGGKAHTYATRLAGNEMRRAHALAERDVAATNPTGGYLRFRTASDHVHIDPCTEIANEPSDYGRGVYPADECPLPPIHIGCKCLVSEVGVRGDEMSDFVEGLRVEYQLEDPPDLSPADLAIFRAETAQVRQDVQTMVRAWFQQTGLVTPEQLAESSGSVAEWIASVAAEKRRRRMAR